GRQRVRDQRLALTAALAAALAIEATALPDVVGEHLGIPVPVDPAAVVSCLGDAVWGGPHDLPVLRARCPHEALVEGLREHTATADELLHGVRRLVRERITHPMPELPARLSAAGVGPAPGVFDSWARFRLDQHRMRDLLMGVQLYKDPDLAVRELYQNALDACRYRSARTQYLDRTRPAAYSYTGAIAFAQGVEDGRPYLECRDNGIGMGESELRGVFSNAGGRFPGQAEFRHERAAWEELDPPIRLYPNSRFGIGVFSYFMLADEIRVTTCRMGLDGVPGPVFEVGIHGPAHLFRIVRVAERGAEPGTTVRLYLNSDRPWSCVKVLRRLLAVAEFDTTAEDGEETATWRPGELQGRSAVAGERFGFHASGEIARWHGAVEGCRVFWCEEGGALLVDGLVVHPAQRRGVCAGPGVTVRGVVVDLSGPCAPERLSVDRTELVDDVSDLVEELLTAAAAELAASEDIPLSYAWICHVATGNPIIADLVTEACIGARRTVSLGDRSVDIARSGCLPADFNLLRTVGINEKKLTYRQMAEIPGPVPNSIFLWRLLAHRSTPMLDELTDFCPELSGFEELRPALPSDQLILATGFHDGGRLRWRSENTYVSTVVGDVVATLGWAACEAEKRIAELCMKFARGPGAAGGGHQRRISLPYGVKSFDSVWFFDRYLRKTLVPPGPIPYRHIFELASNLDLRVSEVVERLREFGFDVRLHVPDKLTNLERSLFEPFGWWNFRTDQAMPYGYLILASDRLHAPVSELENLVRAYGLDISGSVLPRDLTSDRALGLLERDDLEDINLEPEAPLPLQALIDLARRNHTSIAQVIDWLRELGIQVPDLGDTIRAALARVPTTTR
ncbi:HD domain-containing protein, partial [Amycolatopsis vancoresmycina]